MIDSDEDDSPPILVQIDDETPLGSSDKGTKDFLEAGDLPPCPVTILSGHLGAGKTTLVQYILNSPDHGKRIAVIENEFGEGLGVETLIARDGLDNSSLADFIELPNGCLCCTVKDSLVATLENLLDKRRDLDYILIECSGMANPGPIASLFWLDEALESRLRLDGIVTLVDAKNIERQLAETEEASQQIAYADRILINKTDLVSSTSSVVEAVRSIHPTARFRLTTYSSVPDLNWILDTHSFESDRLHEIDQIFNNNSSLPTDHITHNHNHSHHGAHLNVAEHCSVCQSSHRHSAGVTTISLIEAGSINLQKLNQWLAQILWPNQDAEDKVLRAYLQARARDPETSAHNSNTHEQEIFRIKGILSVVHHDATEGDKAGYVGADNLDSRRFIIQAVHDLWDVHAASDGLQWSTHEVRICKLVIIGKSLDHHGLKTGFRACIG